MLELVEFEDRQIRVRLPKQLRQQRPMRFFRGNLVRGKPETRVMVAIDLNFDAPRVEAMKRVFHSTEVRNRPAGNKVERVGPCGFGDEGLELLTSVVQPDTGRTFYRWDLFYRLQGQYVMLSVTGGAPRDDFDSMAREIITSLTLISPPAVTTGS